MSRLALYLPGPPRLELNGEPIQVSRRKAMALLAYLAATGQIHSRDPLATLLWPEYDQSRARADLRRTLSVLNRTLGQEWITADRETVGLNPDADPSTGSGQAPSPIHPPPLFSLRKRRRPPSRGPSSSPAGASWRDWMGILTQR